MMAEINLNSHECLLFLYSYSFEMSPSPSPSPSHSSPLPSPSPHPYSSLCTTTSFFESFDFLNSLWGPSFPNGFHKMVPSDP
jgi:hypothetical protein